MPPSNLSWDLPQVQRWMTTHTVMHCIPADHGFANSLQEAPTTGLFLMHMALLPNCSDCSVSSACTAASARHTTSVVLALPPSDS